MTMVVLALVCAAVGLAANIDGFSVDETWFLSGVVLAVLAFAVAVDEQRLAHLPVHHPGEEWLARGIMLVTGLCGLAGFVLGLMEDDTRNLWGLMAVILALLSLSFAMDAHRVAVARHSFIELRQNRDALAGVLSAAVAFGVGIFGLFTGLFDYPHPEAWLFTGVIFAVVSAAFMFDEQVHTARRARAAAKHTPFAAAKN